MASRSRTLTVSVISDASKVGRGLSSAQLQYGKFAKALGAKSPSFGTEVGDKLVGGVDKALGTGLKLVGGVGGAILGTALFKGFNRLKDIDQAKAKLAGLGHSAKEVDKIMTNATTAVQGTAFGLGEAAGVAAQMVAAGVKPGQQLESTLKGVADAATIGGTSMEDMGSIFGKVAAKNKLQADVINQMTDRGIPVLQLLGDYYGVTAEKASAMVSSGKVDFAGFSAAMEKGVGGAAQKSGTTFTGAWDNVMASLSRVGANLLGPVFEKTKDGLNGLPGLLKPIEDGAKGVGEWLGKMVDWAGKNVTLLTNLGKAAGIFVGAMIAFRTVVAVMQAYQVVLGVVKAAMVGYQAMQAGLTLGTAALTGATTAQRVAAAAGAAAQWLLNAAMSANPVALVVIAIVALIAVFVLLWTKCEGFRKFFIGLWKTLQAAAAAVVNWLRAAWSQLWTWVTTWVRSKIQQAIAVVRTIQAAAAAVWSAIRSAASAAWNAVVSVVRGAISGVRSVISGVVGFFRSAWSGISSVASSVFGGLRGVASTALNAILGPVRAVRGAFDAVASVVRRVIDFISQLRFPSPPGWLSKIVGASAPVTIAPATPGARLTRGLAPAPVLGYDAALAGALGASGGGSFTVININGALDPDAVSRQVRSLLLGSSRTTGGITMNRRTA